MSMGGPKNPNNCETCDYKRAIYEGKDKYHCYMFADAPTERCMQHRSEQSEFGTPVIPIPDDMRNAIQKYMDGGHMLTALQDIHAVLADRNEQNPKQPVRQIPVLRIVK